MYILGLKVLYFFSFSEVKGLLLVVFEDFNLILFFEYKGLYCSISEEVLIDYYILLIGKVCLVIEGEDVLIIIYGMGVYWVKILV